MSYLIVGDIHATPSELKECISLKTLILDVLVKNKIENVIFLGDQFNEHSILNTAVIDFWNSFIVELDNINNLTHIYMIVGNHDFYSPTIMFPHALISLKGVSKLVVFDKLMQIADSTAITPYSPDPNQFLEQIKSIENSNIKNIICHQTFNGAKYANGFYAKDAVDPKLVNFNIISGHVHTAHAFENVWYPGSPRWRTLSDANQDKFLYIVEFGSNGFGIKEKIPTYPTCRRIIKLVDQEGQPLDSTEHYNGETYNTDFRVDIYGSQDYISNKVTTYKACLKARVRTFPTRLRSKKLTEADGISISFKKYCQSFVSPNKTDSSVLMKEAEGRLNE